MKKKEEGAQRRTEKRRKRTKMKNLVSYLVGALSPVSHKGLHQG